MLTINNNEQLLWNLNKNKKQMQNLIIKDLTKNYKTQLKKREFLEAFDSDQEYYKNIKVMKLCDIEKLEEELKNTE